MTRFTHWACMRGHGGTGVVARAWDPSTPEAEADAVQIVGQLGLFMDIMPQNKTKQNKAKPTKAKSLVWQCTPKSLRQAGQHNY